MIMQNYIKMATNKIKHNIIFLPYKQTLDYNNCRNPMHYKTAVCCALPSLFVFPASPISKICKRVKNKMTKRIIKLILHKKST